MKRNTLKIIPFLALILLPLLGATGYSQQEKGEAKPNVIGYIDKNKDGINDFFADANGDGINDVTKLRYEHTFRFEDKNNDQLNDLWRDKDGDGINDLMIEILKSRGIRPETPWVDRDGDGIQDKGVKAIIKADLSEFVLDADNDGYNDISGIHIEKDNAMGYRYGCIDEETSDEPYKFKDKNGDGMHDSFADRLEMDMKNGPRRLYDYFIDTDGDGISDGRRFQRMNKGKTGNSYGKKKSP